MTPVEVAQFRAATKANADANMAHDVGYFITWYSAVELGITALLAFAAKAPDLTTFDTLCSGMDLRVKIERLRKILKSRGGIGVNLDTRLRLIDDKARRTRNRLAHSFMSHSESGEVRYSLPPSVPFRGTIWDLRRPAL